MKLVLKKGITSQTALIFILDSSSTIGAGLANLVYNSAGLTWYYYREAAGTGPTQVTPIADMTLGTWTTRGFKAVDNTNMPGWYEIGIPDAALASGADFVGMQLKGATNMAPVNIEIQLTNETLCGVDVSTALTELGVAQPSATPSMQAAVMLLYMALRNKTVVQTSGTDALEIYNAAGTMITSKLLTDNGSDYTEAQMT